jgi:predicted Zn-dependent protease
MTQHAVEAATRGTLSRMNPQTRKFLIGLLAGGAEINSLRYDRQQESEADHIGLFLMTFAGYDPKQAVVFWQRMERLSRSRGRTPAILSNHPSDAARLRDIEKWIPNAEAALRAYKSGNVARS